MPAPSARRVAARFIQAGLLERASKDVAALITKLIRAADIPVEARRYTRYFWELSQRGGKGWIPSKEFNDALVRPRSAMQYVYGAAGHVNDDGEAINERKEYLGEAANTILLKTGIIGRRAE